MLYASDAVLSHSWAKKTHTQKTPKKQKTKQKTDAMTYRVSSYATDDDNDDDIVIIIIIIIITTTTTTITITITTTTTTIIIIIILQYDKGSFVAQYSFLMKKNKIFNQTINYIN